MENRVIAMAIDLRTVRSPSEHNPEVTTVPATVKNGQQALDHIMRSVIESIIDEDDDLAPEDVAGQVPRYDYVWYGSIHPDGTLHGSECTEEYHSIKPWSDKKVLAAVKKAKEE